MALSKITKLHRCYKHVVFAASLSALSSILGAATVNVSTPTSSAFVIDRTKAAATFWLDVSMSETVDLSKVTVELQMVRRDNQAVVPDQYFKVEPKLVDKGRQAPMLGISVSKIGDLLPGVYTLTFLLRDEAKTAFAPLTVTLTLPSVQLPDPGKQTVDIELQMPYGDRIDFAPKYWSIPLTTNGESSAMARFAAITGPFESDTHGVAASLVKRIDIMGSAGVTELILTLDPEHFPVGKTTGKITIRGNSLQTSQTFDVEVNTRLRAAWVAIIVALGLFIGWLVRIFLQHRIDLYTARTTGATILSQALSKTNDIADAEFNTAYDAAALLLQDALIGNDNSKIPAAIDTFQKTLADATDRLNLRLSSAHGAFEAMQALSPKGPLPESLISLCTDLEAGLVPVTALLNHQDALKAQEVLDQASKKFLEGIRLETRKSARLLDDANKIYSQLKQLFDPSTMTARESSLVWLDEVPTNLVFTSDPDVRESAEMLGAWRAFGDQRSENLHDLSGFLADDGLKLALLATRVASSEAVTTAASNWQDQMGLMPLLDDDSVVWTVPSIDVASIVEAQEALKVAVAETLGAGRAAFEEDWVSKGPFEALHNLPPSPAPSPLPPSLAPFRSISATSLSTISLSLNSDERETTLRLRPTDRSAVPIQRFSLRSAAAVEAFQARSRWAQIRATSLQTICVGAIVIWSSYVAFGAHFVGTPPELIGLFIWGFSADFSVASLSALISPFKAKV